MGDKKTIYIVEDELDFAKMMKIRLEAAGYDVKVATDAYLGTQDIIKGDPDLIILDLMMPAGGGFSLLERIQMIPAKSSIPVVILTGKTVDDIDRAKAEKYGVAAIIQKPYDSRQFMETIRAVLSHMK